VHSIEITSSSTSAVPAGGVVTLTCEVESNLPTELTWTGPSGPLASGGGVSVITNIVDERTIQSTLAFHPLSVSHAGQYICHSTQDGTGEVVEANTIISVQVPQPAVTPILTVDGLVPVTDPDSFTLSLLVELDPAVDVPLQLVAKWSGHPSLSDNPRVQPGAVPLQAPYLASLVFSSIKPRDLGVYTLTVELGDSSRPGVVSSIPLELDVTLSLDLHLELGTGSPSGPTEDCLVSNGGCDQICTPTNSGRDCSCLPGYSLNPDGTTCNGKYSS
jgi:hypothetical protein